MCTILIVDDEQDIRDGLHEELRLQGHTALTASNGEEALRFLKDGEGPRPCLLVLDLRMPIMDGWDFLGELRKEAGWQHLPVIVLSATLARGAAPPVLRAQAFWSKPPASDQIRDITRYCDQHGKTASLA